MNTSERDTNEHAAMNNQNDKAHSLPVGNITPDLVSTFGLGSTANDLPGLVTQNEIRYCQYCKADTPHRVGIHKQFVDRPTYTQTKVSEYSHCSVCGNTATIIKKVTIMKVQS